MVFWRANNHAASRENVRRPLATSAVSPTSSTTGSSNAKTSCITECLRSQRFQDGADGHPVASTALMCSWNRVSPHRHSWLHWAALVDAKPDSTRHGRWPQQLRPQGESNLVWILLCGCCLDRSEAEDRQAAEPLLTGRNASVMNLLTGTLIALCFQKTAMLGRGIATEVNLVGITASLAPLPGGSA